MPYIIEDIDWRTLKALVGAKEGALSRAVDGVLEQRAIKVEEAEDAGRLATEVVSRIWVQWEEPDDESRG